jgi:hypothetical protein
MNQSVKRSKQVFFYGLWIVSIPDCGVVVSRGWNHCGSHDGSNVESRPLRHERVEQFLNLEIFISSFSQFLLNWNSSWIVKRIWVVPVVVCLHQEPLSLTQFVVGMNTFSVSFDNTSFVLLNSRQNVVDWTTDLFVLESLLSPVVSSLFSQSSSQKPNCWNAVVEHNADQIVVKMLCFSGIDINRKCTVANACQSEHTADDCVN